MNTVTNTLAYFTVVVIALKRFIVQATVSKIQQSNEG
jgi:hypothetical protein